MGEETGKTRLQSVRLMDALLCLWFEFLERPECHRNPSRLEPFRRQWVACNSNNGNWYTNSFPRKMFTPGNLPGIFEVCSRLVLDLVVHS